MSEARPVEERFWEKVDKSGGPDACWPWQACFDHGGYGRFHVSRTRTNVGSHIVAWELENRRKVPAGLWVMHSCNNPPCCNPAHLSPGTSQEDADHRVACGHQAKQKGVSHGRAKLTDDAVREIRRLRGRGMLLREIAVIIHGIDLSVVSKIYLRKSWAHVR